jgi:membrane-associated phospholipid phosphatase
VFVINFFYKVSIHTTAAGILPGFCITLMLNNSLVIVLPLLLALLIAATVGIIRWLLGAHTMGQILLGYAVGILTQLATFFYLNT